MVCSARAFTGPSELKVGSLKFKVPVGIQGIWEFSKIRCTILGFPIIRSIVFWCLYWGPLILGNYHVSKKCVRGD